MILKAINKEELVLSSSGVARRLSVPRDFDKKAFSAVEEELLAVMDCKMAAVRVPSFVKGGEVLLGTVSVQSKDLAKSIGDADEAFVFAVTLGMGVERMLNRLSKTSVSTHFVADALASAYAEAAIERAQSILEGEAKTKKRFSPGYGDLPLEIQPEILEMLNAKSLLGIMLTDTLLMKPQKSITAIVGIENE